MIRTLVAVLALGAGATAQPPQDNPLSGPPVKQNRPAGLEGQFTEGRGDRRGPMVDRVPFRLYAQGIAKLRADDAPAALKLSAEQNEKITALETEFRSAQREFAQKLRQAGGGAAGGDQNRPARRREAAQGEDMPPRDQAKLEEIRRQAPKAEDFQVKIYAMLTAEQKQFVEGEVAKAREELDRRRGEEYMQREMEKRKSSPDAQRPDAQRPDAPPAEMRERYRRLVERLQQLPPDQREQLLRRLEEELDRRAGNPAPSRPGRTGENAPDSDKEPQKNPRSDKRP